MNRVMVPHRIMAMAERGSFMWALVSITQIFLAIKLMDDLEGWLSIILGPSGAACAMIALIMYKQEKDASILNPLKQIQKEVHPDQIAKQGRGVWYGVAIWFIAMVFGAIAL